MNQTLVLQALTEFGELLSCDSPAYFTLSEFADRIEASHGVSDPRIAELLTALRS